MSMGRHLSRDNKAIAGHGFDVMPGQRRERNASEGDYDDPFIRGRSYSLTDALVIGREPRGNWSDINHSAKCRHSYRRRHPNHQIHEGIGVSNLLDHGGTFKKRLIVEMNQHLLPAERTQSNDRNVGTRARFDGEIGNIGEQHAGRMALDGVRFLSNVVLPVPMESLISSPGSLYVDMERPL